VSETDESRTQTTALYKPFFEKKGYAIMHVFAIVVVWFYLIIAGIILTMLMPRVA
jgi:hypothetical protein